MENQVEKKLVRQTSICSTATTTTTTTTTTTATTYMTTAVYSVSAIPGMCPMIILPLKSTQ